METKDRNGMHLTGKSARRRTSASHRPEKTPEEQIMYTPAKPFNRNRFLLRCATIAAVVLALVLCMSIFFKAKNVMVSGAVKYTAWDVKEASGIHESDGLLGLSEAKISAKIRAALPYVKQVRVGIKLPDTVNIEIVEFEVTYAAEDSVGIWWLLDAGGRVIDRTDVAAAMDHTIVMGVKLLDPVIGETAVAAEPEAQTEEGTDATQPLVPTVSASQRLAAAVEIFQALESNGVMGNVDSVDVSNLNELTIWYENRYLINLGDTGRLEYKIGAMKAAALKMGEYQRGYLDVSFTLWPDQVHFSRFEDET